VTETSKVKRWYRARILVLAKLLNRASETPTVLFRKNYREVGPLVEGPEDVYICGECIELCQSILDQERRRRGASRKLFNRVPTPREIVR